MPRQKDVAAYIRRLLEFGSEQNHAGGGKGRAAPIAVDIRIDGRVKLIISDEAPPKP
jgi:hypothetical protein